MDDQRMHRPIWREASSGGSQRPMFCTRCGVRRGQPAAHPIHYARRDERGGWDLYCARYGEATATGLTFKTADALARAHEDGSDPCGCEVYA